MELVKLIHDLAITAGCIALAILPRAVVTLLEAKGRSGTSRGEELSMDAFIIACLALRRRIEEKRSPDPEFQPFRLEFIRSVTETCDKP